MRLIRSNNDFLNYSFDEIDSFSTNKENDFFKLSKLGGGKIEFFQPNGNVKRKVRVVSLFQGTYGDVFRVRHRSTGEIFALKQIRDEHELNGIPATAMREATILKQLNHANIIKLKDVFFSDERCFFLLEYMDEDLKRYLDRNRPIERSKTRNFMFQLFQAIFYCHRHRVIHRDIKPHNILVNSKGQIKLCDFGLARTFSVPMKVYTHEIVTLWYRAPEILLGSFSYGTPVDIWSLGCIFAELYQGWPLFHGDSEIDQIFQIFKILGTPTEIDWPTIFDLPQFKSSFPKFRVQQDQIDQIMGNDRIAIDLLQKLLMFDPSKRIAARHALRHQYFTVNL